MATAQLAQAAPQSPARRAGKGDATPRSAKTDKQGGKNFAALIKELLGKKLKTSLGAAKNGKSARSKGAARLPGGLRSAAAGRKALRPGKGGLKAQLEQSLSGQVINPGEAKGVKEAGSGDKKGPADGASAVSRERAPGANGSVKKADNVELVKQLRPEEVSHGDEVPAGDSRPESEMAAAGQREPSPPDGLLEIGRDDGSVRGAQEIEAGAAQATAADRSPGAAKVVVVDLRTRSRARPKAEPGGLADKDGARAARTEGASPEQEEPSVRYIVRPPPDTREGEAPNSIMRRGQPAPLQAQESLSPRFGETLRNEIVRHSGIVLRDGGKGEIRLVLKPESLGCVRIRLNLDNNHIEGRIIVENNTVKEMFEANLRNLSSAFQREGFSSTTLEVSVGGEGARERQRHEEVPVYDAVRNIEKCIPWEEEYRLSERLVDLTA